LSSADETSTGTIYEPTTSIPIGSSIELDRKETHLNGFFGFGFDGMRRSVVIDEFAGLVLDGATSAVRAIVPKTTYYVLKAFLGMLFASTSKMTKSIPHWI